MLRRTMIVGGLATAGTTAIGRKSGGTAWAEDATPEVPACDLDLDAADLSVSLVIPETIPDNEWANIERSLLLRVAALEWTSCSLDRSGRELFLNVQLLRTPEQPGTAEIELLLSQPGRIDLVDGGQGAIEIGDRIVTTPLPPDAPEINVVYTTVVSNRDFASVSISTTAYGQDVVRFEVDPEGADRLAEFTFANIGGQMPLVVDGIVIANPIIQSEIGDSFDLQTDDPVTIRRVVVYGAAPEYQAPLEIAFLNDARTTRENRR